VRVEVIRPRCEGHGLCEEVAPAIFSLDSDGELIHAFDGREIPPELEAAARSAVTVCPVAALLIERSGQ
jgi:ferredoxin